MMPAPLLLLAWEALCLALFWSVFCRLVRAGPTTRLDVRLALIAVGMASLAGLGAPLYGWAPDWITLIIIGPVVALQVVASGHWAKGVPWYFIHPNHRPRRRTGDMP